MIPTTSTTPIPNRAWWCVAERLEGDEKKLAACVCKQWNAANLPSGPFENLPREALWTILPYFPRVVHQEFRLVNREWCALTTDFVNAEKALKSEDVKEFLNFIVSTLDKEIHKEVIDEIQEVSQVVEEKTRSLAIFETQPPLIAWADYMGVVLGHFRTQDPAVFNSLSKGAPDSKFSRLCFEHLNLCHRAATTTYFYTCIHDLCALRFFNSALHFADSISFIDPKIAVITQIVHALFWRGSIYKADAVIQKNTARIAAMRLVDDLLTYNLDHLIDTLPFISTRPAWTTNPLAAHGRIKQAFKAAQKDTDEPRRYVALTELIEYFLETEDPDICSLVKQALEFLQETSPIWVQTDIAVLNARFQIAQRSLDLKHSQDSQ